MNNPISRELNANREILEFSADSVAGSDVEKAPLPRNGRQHVLLKTKNVPNLQNTIHNGNTEVNTQLNSVVNLLRQNNRNARCRNIKQDDVRGNRLDITRSAHYNLPVSKPTSVSSTDTLSMLIEVGCNVGLGMRKTELGRAKLARIYIFVSPGYLNPVKIYQTIMTDF